MSEELMNISHTQVVDVVVQQKLITIFFLGGVSNDELEVGGHDLGMFNMGIELSSETEAMQARSMLVKWYAASEPVSVVVHENGSAKITNEDSEACLRVNYGAGS